MPRRRSHAPTRESVEKWPHSIFAFAWRRARHQPWLCVLAGAIFPITMAPLELQRRIIDRAIGDQNLELLFWLGEFRPAAG